jgi:hypothetical protein
MLSDDKIMHISHLLLKGLKAAKAVKTTADDAKIRKEIKGVIAGRIKAGQEIEETVRKKLQSYSRKIVEGSSEWDILYRKFFDEEDAKKGGR